MELVQIKGNTWCLKGQELIPLYKLDERRCILLDSGLEIEQEDLDETLQKTGLIPVGVLGSHNHTDHTGSNRFLKEKYGTKICMSESEAAIAKNAGILKMGYAFLSLDVMMQYVGAMIFPTDQVVPERDGEVEFMGATFRIHYTPGHSPGHICIGTPDGVCYVGDLVIVGKLQEKAQLPYHLIQRGARASMEKMCHVTGYSHYIMAHRGITEDLKPAVKENLEILDGIANHILSLLEKPMTWEELMVRVLERTHLFTSNEKKCVLYERCVQSFLDDLRDTGKITIEVRRGIRYYQRV